MAGAAGSFPTSSTEGLHTARALISYLASAHGCLMIHRPPEAVTVLWLALMEPLLRAQPS